jgi:hypothetical protein
MGRSENNFQLKLIKIKSKWAILKLLTLFGTFLVHRVLFGRPLIYTEGGTLLYERIGLIRAYTLVLKVMSLIVTRN